MEIIWYGHACFRLREKGITIITDPYDKSLGYTLPRLRADVVTSSHPAPGHAHVSAIRGDPKVLNGPGEYEIRGIFITGIPTWHAHKRGQPDERNTVFLFDFNGISVCHLGDLGHVLSEDQVEAIGEVGVLLIPVGGGRTLDASRASEVISQLEPRIVIPMHYKTPTCACKLDKIDKFLRAMGISSVETRDALKLSASQLPDETQVVLLDYKQG
ncbi:MAG TPA: MBL fold metallo-hydrolase [Caldilineae bacterium]|nr:MBL fold metallo-hydrolase [Caldilineae bacterium]